MNPPTLGIYKHYKGDNYEVIGVGKLEATLEDVVIYKALYGEGEIWVRDLGDFCSNVGDTPRFTKIT